MGFRWKSNAPRIVILDVGTQGIVNISAVHFNIDGDIIQFDKPASVLTEYGDWSYRRFLMPLEQFRRMANAEVVKMKVIMIDNYTVSSFGRTENNAIVNGKFRAFLEQVDTQLKKIKK